MLQKNPFIFYLLSTPLWKWHIKTQGQIWGNSIFWGDGGKGAFVWQLALSFGLQGECCPGWQLIDLLGWCQTHCAFFTGCLQGGILILPFPGSLLKPTQSKLLLTWSFLLFQPCSDRYLCYGTICYLHIPRLKHRLALVLWQFLRCKTHFSWHLPQLIHPPIRKPWEDRLEMLYILISL